jgi:hypothetical protein
MEDTLSPFRHLHSGNSPIPFCHTFVTLLAAHLRSGASPMSRTFRTLALSAALLVTAAPAFASAPTGTNPPPSFISMLWSMLGL